jgi:pyruvate kinase
LETLIQSGMNVARLNFSHGDHAGHAAVLERVRQAANNSNRNIGT